MKISIPLVPAFTSTLLGRFVLGIGISGVTLGITAIMLPQSTAAQTARDVEPLGEFTTPQSEQDSFGGSRSGFSVFDLIHRSQQGGVLDFNQFSNDKRQELDNAAEAYRRLQLQQLNQLETPMEPTPESPTAN